MADEKKAEAKAETPKAYIIDGAGRSRTVSDPDEQDRLASEGAKFISRERAQADYQKEVDRASMESRYGTVGQFGMGAASGLTLGLGPQALAGLAGDEQMKRDLGAMGDSGGFLAGEAAGMLLPAIFSGGESLMARGAAMTPAGALSGVGGMAERLAMRVLPESTGVLGRAGSEILGMAARGGTEGALMSLSHQVGQNIIHNKPLTAEALAAAGEGALFGGLMGGGLGALGAGVGAVGETLATKGMGVAARRSEGVVARELGIASEADMVRFSGGKDFREALKELEQIRTQAGETIGGSIGKGSKEVNRVAKQMVTEAQEVQQDVLRILDREAPGHVPNLNRIHSRIQTEVAADALGTYNQQVVKNVADGVFQRLANVADAPQGKVWAKFAESRDQIRSSIDDYLQKAFDPSMDRQLIKSIKADVLNIIDHELTESMTGAAKLVNRSGLSEQFNAAVTAQRTAEHLQELTASKLANEARSGQSLFTPLDMAQFGGAAMWNPVWATGMLAAKGTTRLMEARVAPKLAEMAYNMAVGGKAAAATVGIKKRVQGAVKGLFKGTKTSANYAATKAPKGRDEYEKHVERAHELISPLHQARVQAMARQMEAAGHIELAAQTLMMNQRAVQYLQHNLPPSKSAKGASKLGPMPKVQGMDLKDYKFMRLFSALEDTGGFIDRIASGDVSRDEVKAVKYVYPELHAEIVSEATQAIYEMKSAGEFLDANKIAMLGVVLDAPVDATLTPEYVNAVQASFAPPAQPPQPSAPVDQGVMVSGADYQTATQKVSS